MEKLKVFTSTTLVSAIAIFIIWFGGFLLLNDFDLEKGSYQESRCVEEMCREDGRYSENCTCIDREFYETSLKEAVMLRVQVSFFLGLFLGVFALFGCAIRR